MMSKIEFDVNAMTLTVSKKFWNNASVPFSPEYDMIKRIRHDYPRCQIVVIDVPFFFCDQGLARK